MSENYRGICLLADEHLTIESPVGHDLVHMAYRPIVQLHEPKQKLPHADALRLAEKMREIVRYILSDHIYKAKILQMLYAVFLLDLQDVQDNALPLRQVPLRVEELFIGFIRLLPLHFARHHDIAFYADALHISPVYLSRIVRQVTEASFLLATTPLTIGQVADRLHFADTPSFSKFFHRLKGTTPRAYRHNIL